MDPGAGLESTEYLVPTGIRFPDRPSCSQSLCQLNYTAHMTQRIAVISNNYSLSNNPQERSCQQTGVTLRVTEIGALGRPFYKFHFPIDTDVGLRFAVNCTSA